MEGICRTCLIVSSSLSTIFQDDLPAKIKSVSSIEVKEDDELSDKICSECVKTLNVCYTFRKLIIKCNSVLKMAVSEDEGAIHKANRHDIGKIIEDDNLCEMTMEVEEPDEVFIKDDDVEEESIHSDSEIPKSTKRVNKYQCKICLYQGTNRKDLAKHTGSVHKQMVPCEVCKLPFTKANLRRHIFTHSTKDESITCPICNRVFKNYPSYYNHPKEHIPEESTCEICGKQFHFLGERLRHLYKHNGKDLRAACEVCGKVFKKKLLAQHRLVHTGEKPHVCSFCGKRFTSRWAMRTHERQHTNETPYKCELCPMAFRQRVSLNTHVRSKH